MPDPMPVEFRGRSLETLRGFALAARREMGHQIDLVQHGQAPDDWRPLNTVGQGVREVRIWNAAVPFRVICAGEPDDAAVYVLHCFQPRTEKTGKDDRELAAAHYRDLFLLPPDRAMGGARFASVWDAIESTTQAAEDLKLRSALMTVLKQHLADSRVSQPEAAEFFGLPPPQIADLVRGKVNAFGTETLVSMVTAARLPIEMQILEVAPKRSAWLKNR